MQSKYLFIIALLILGLVGALQASDDFLEVEWLDESSETEYTTDFDARPVAKRGARCSDGTYCKAKYKHCCEVNGVPDVCVVELKDCKNN